MLAIKTYKPKKPVYKEIENVHDLCRLCLEEAQDGVVIFQDGKDVCAAVAMRIMICVGLDMKCEQSLPNMICKTCYEELEKYYKFRKKCQMSYQKLKHHILALKLKHQNVKTDIPLQNIPLHESVGHCGPDRGKQDVVNDEKPLSAQSDVKPSEVIDNGAGKAVEIEEVPIQSEVDPDISTFLSTILTELRILTQEQGLLQHQGVSTFELETGDEEQLVLELVEEDDETSNKILEKQPDIESGDSEDRNTMIIDVKQPAGATRHGKMSHSWCSLCGWSFSSRSALTRHLRGHTGARPHACDTCGASFAQKAVLQRHMLVHLEVRPHRCSACSKSFTQRAALEAHARTHAAPHARPLALHTCVACNKVFLYASGLSRHMASHEGRVYGCSACDKYFKDRSSLTRHLRNVCQRRADTITGDTSTLPPLEQ